MAESLTFLSVELRAAAVSSPSWASHLSFPRQASTRASIWFVAPSERATARSSRISACLCGLWRSISEEGETEEIPEFLFYCNGSENLPQTSPSPPPLETATASPIPAIITATRSTRAPKTCVRRESGRPATCFDRKSELEPSLL